MCRQIKQRAGGDILTKQQNPMNSKVATAADSFAFRLKDSRKKAKLTQKQLGALAGIAFQGVWNYENRGDEPAASLLFALADALCVDPRWLLTGKTASGETGQGLSTGKPFRIALHLSCLPDEKLNALTLLLGIKL